MRADARALKQILLNLLSNAVKFTEAGGRVAVSAGIGGGGLTIVVADNGIGMAPEDIPEALSSFGQIHSTYTRERDGTGLGLPLVKALVELHGGALEIDSAPGASATATVRLPRARFVAKPMETSA